MGTRADFYIGRGTEAEWLGSIAWDGYPDGLDDYVLGAQTEAQFRSAVSIFSKTRDDWTSPEAGWPWPWENSNTTDYAYAFDGERVWASGFGSEWFRPLVDDEPEDSGTQSFPDMTARRVVAKPGSKRSGVIVIGGGS